MFYMIVFLLIPEKTKFRTTLSIH